MIQQLWELLPGIFLSTCPFNYNSIFDGHLYILLYENKKASLVLEVKDKSSAMTQIPKDVKRRKKDKKKSKNSAKTETNREVNETEHKPTDSEVLQSIDEH